MDEQSTKQIEITVQLTFEDHCHAVQAHASLKPSFFLFACGSMVLAGVGLLLVFHRNAGSFYNGIGSVLIMGICFLLIRVLNPGLRQQFENNKKLSLPQDFAISDEGISLTADYGPSQITWDGLVKYVETKEVFLLYSQPGIFHAFPKRAFMPEQLARFGQMVRERILAKMTVKQANEPFIRLAVMWMAIVIALLVVFILMKQK